MIKHDFNYKFTKGNLSLSVTIPGYIWMYHQGKDIAVDIADQHGGDNRFQSKLHMELNSEQELIDFINKCELTESNCKHCKQPMIARAPSYYIKGDECEKCRLAAINKEMEHIQKEQALETAKIEREMYAKGHRWKVVAWVHAGGDDECIEWYFPIKPTDTKIKGLIRREGSVVTDDFSVKELKA